MIIEQWDKKAPSIAKVCFNKKEQEMLIRDHSNTKLGHMMPRYEVRKHKRKVI